MVIFLLIGAITKGALNYWYYIGVNVNNYEERLIQAPAL